MAVYLGIAILLFILITFVPREGFEPGSDKKGYYTDSNVTNAVDDLTTLNKNLTELKTTMTSLSTKEYSAIESISSVSKVLLTKDSALFTNGVMTSVEGIKKDLDSYQDDLSQLNKLMTQLQKIEMLTLSDEKEGKKKFSISGGIDHLIERSKEISSKLNKIPSG